VEATWHEGVAPYASNLVIVLVLIGVTVALPYLFPSFTRD
jgi:hypothetical protein